MIGRERLSALQGRRTGWGGRSDFGLCSSNAEVNGVGPGHSEREERRPAGRESQTQTVTWLGGPPGAVTVHCQSQCVQSLCVRV